MRRTHKHCPRPDVTAVCPDPEHCEHTTYFEGESCECCGLVPYPLPRQPRAADEDYDGWIVTVRGGVDPDDDASP